MTLNNTRSKGQRCPIYVLLKSQAPNFHHTFPFDQPFSRYKVSIIGNALNDFGMTLNTFNSQRHPVYIKYLPPMCKLLSVSLYDELLSRYKVIENQKCTKWPQTDCEHWTVKNTQYILRIYPWGLKIHPYCSTTSRFRDSRLWKNGKIGNAPKMTSHT